MEAYCVLLKGSIGAIGAPRGVLNTLKNPVDLGPQTISEALLAAFRTEDFQRPVSSGSWVLKE